MFRALFRLKATYFLVLLFGALVVWWLAMRYLYEPSANQTYIFNAAYGSVALFSFVAALVIAGAKWGGWRSLIGKMLILLGLGLFLEWLGSMAWFYFNLTGFEVPYPSIADLGYFGLVPFYIAASVVLAHATGLRFTLKSSKAKLLLLLLPAAALLTAFGLFLRKVGYDGGEPLKLFFDIAYPVGEIIPVTIALLVLILSTRLLSGSVMRGRVIWLVFAFFMQFLAEYVFLYQAGAGIYENAGVADLLYLVSYFVMGVGILSFYQLGRGGDNG